MSTEKTCEIYQGFELGPIRPPSEAQSLLLRVTRNCPWNRCKFCGLYRGQKFALRPVSHVKKDIDLVRGYMEKIQEAAERSGDLPIDTVHALSEKIAGQSERAAFYSALNWVHGEKKSVFLQDSNSLIMKPKDLVEILEYIKNSFPQVERITSYARADTAARISDEDLARIRAAGLSRIHIGMESGSDRVLSLVKKGVDKERQIIGGRKVKQAGIELSEYFMPGLGGKDLSRENALESADALNQINPDFIRIRTLALPDHVELSRDAAAGAFKRLGDRETTEELLLFLERLNGITSTVKSDHLLNLFQEVEGALPDAQGPMTEVIKKFLALEPEEQMLYQIGRRSGIFSELEDLKNPYRRRYAERICAELHVTPENLDQILEEMMKRFV